MNLLSNLGKGVLETCIYNEEGTNAFAIVAEKLQSSGFFVMLVKGAFICSRPETKTWVSLKCMKLSPYEQTLRNIVSLVHFRYLLQTK